MFTKLLCIVNIRWYKKEQLILHLSLLGMKGRGAKHPFEQPSFQHLAVTLKINMCTPNFVKSTTNLTNTHQIASIISKFSPGTCPRAP